MVKEKELDAAIDRFRAACGDVIPELERDEPEPDLGAIEARANAATPGPWGYDLNGYIAPDLGDEWGGTVAKVLGKGGQFDKDGEFIAHARTDIPALLAEVRRLRAECAPAGGWQPIDTAPTKGRIPILLWRDGMDFPQTAFANTWWTAGFSAGIKPTHWMKLAAPTEGE